MCSAGANVLRALVPPVRRCCFIEVGHIDYLTFGAVRSAFCCDVALYVTFWLLFVDGALHPRAHHRVGQSTPDVERTGCVRRHRQYLRSPSRGDRGPTHSGLALILQSSACCSCRFSTVCYLVFSMSQNVMPMCNTFQLGMLQSSD